MTLLERLTAPGPKRILALDGGGIRGALTVGFLERIEAILRERHHSPRLRLCDYFDLIGGTSTGSIIAAGLAIGMEAAEVRQTYLDLGGRVFGKKQWRRWEAAFDPRPLEEELAKVFGTMTLGDTRVLTGLCIVTKRADTSSLWPLINHPNGAFFTANQSIRVRDAIRASAAAPTYFVPETIEVEPGQVGAFVDGGVSMANNPALLLFLVATLQGFPFRWRTGEDDLLLVSVGTGSWSRRVSAQEAADSRLWDWASAVPAMLMDDANWQNQLLLQYLSRTPTPWQIDSEVGDLRGDVLGGAPALSYLRYNVLLEADALRRTGLAAFAPQAEALREMSAAENRFALTDVGAQAAAQQVQDAHFPRAFDLPL